MTTEDRSLVPSLLKTARMSNNGWTPEQEDLMAEWSDKAICYRWLHERTEKIFTRKNAMFVIPIIVLSTLTGTASVGLDSFVPVEFQKTAQGIVGGVSILTGIIGTVANFLRYAQGMEAHRSTGLAWGKLQRRVAVELALAPPQRQDCAEFLKLCRAELDRLIEQAPTIPDEVIAEFEYRFRDVPDLKLPEVCNSIEHTFIFRPEKAERIAEIALKMKTKEGDAIKKTLIPEETPAVIEKDVIQRNTSIHKTMQQKIDDDLARLRTMKTVSKWKPLAPPTTESV